MIVAAFAFLIASFSSRSREVATAYLPLSSLIPYCYQFPYIIFSFLFVTVIPLAMCLYIYIPSYCLCIMTSLDGSNGINL